MELIRFCYYRGIRHITRGDTIGRRNVDLLRWFYQYTVICFYSIQLYSFPVIITLYPSRCWPWNIAGISDPFIAARSLYTLSSPGALLKTHVFTLSRSILIAHNRKPHLPMHSSSNPCGPWGLAFISSLDLKELGIITWGTESCESSTKPAIVRVILRLGPEHNRCCRWLVFSSHSSFVNCHIPLIISSCRYIMTNNAGVTSGDYIWCVDIRPL